MNLKRREFLAALTPFLFRSRLTDDPKRPELPESGDPDLVKTLRKLCLEHELPGMTASIVKPGGPKSRRATVGYRRLGNTEPLSLQDLVHLGSDTKAMTATMMATLVEEGQLSWSTSLADVFANTKIDPGYRKVTLTQLLTHRAGLPANLDWWGLGKDKSTKEQREQILELVLTKPPTKEPGSVMLYSNVGYALAGLVAETVANSTWEELMEARLFRPLGMETAGFGIPGAIGKTNQPWGHKKVLGKQISRQIDNAPALGPAGTVHCSMSDWAKFAELHLRGARGEKTPILKPETFQILQTPAKGEDYAMGWIIKEHQASGGRALLHVGSNTWWHALIWLAPAKNSAYLVVCNDGDEAAGQACYSAVESMMAM